MTARIIELLGVRIERFENRGYVVVGQTGVSEFRHVPESHGFGIILIDPSQAFRGIGLLVVALGKETVGLQAT